MKRKSCYGKLICAGHQSIYDEGILSMTDADSAETKYDTEPYANLSDSKGPTSKYERARKVSENLNDLGQFANTRWNNDDPVHASNDTVYGKDDVDELKEIVESGDIAEEVSDPCTVEELAYCLCYNKTTSGEHDYESLERAEQECRQRGKVDYSNREEQRMARKGGFF